jgi:hypothetical protein
MRSNGFNLPPPNTTGRGSIFGNVNRGDPKFTAALAKCRSALGGFFGGGAGAQAGG